MHQRVIAIMTSKKRFTYKSAGVDIDAGETLVNRIKKSVSRTHRPEVIGGLGGFGGLFKLALDHYRHPVLVSGADGVGTKLKLAIEHNAHDTIGIDLVAMCANDVVVQGAEPLFFLDYFATQSLDLDIATRVIKGIAHGCKMAGASLIGGETAEHPGMGTPGEYDLAGFCVGIVEQDQLIDGTDITQGNKVIGLASSGPHANGYSLIREVLKTKPDALRQEQLLDAILQPTRIYATTVLTLLKETHVKGLAHITGGGLLENIPRILPDGLGVRLERKTWEWPQVFHWLENSGIAGEEMLRTFNCGLGMVAVVDASNVEKTLSCLKKQGEKAWLVGEVIPDLNQKVTVD